MKTLKPITEEGLQIQQLQSDLATEAKKENEGLNRDKDELESWLHKVELQLQQIESLPFDKREQMFKKLTNFMCDSMLADSTLTTKTKP